MPSKTGRVESIKLPQRLEAEWEAMKQLARASGQSFPEYILGSWRLRREREKAPAPTQARTAETPFRAMMRGVILGRLYEDLRRAFEAGAEDTVEVGWYRKWYPDHRLDANYLREWLGAERFGQRYVDWWDREIVDWCVQRAGRTAS